MKLLTYEKSFASHPRASNWSKNNTKQPHEVNKCTHDKYEFECFDCGHTFKAIVKDVTYGHWCRYCNGKQKGLLCDNSGCNFCFNRSFASHTMSKYWSSDNKFSPRQITKFSEREAKFNCPHCPHTFTTVIASVATGHGCAYCTNKKLCNDENCTLCFNKSFASHTRAQFWSVNNLDRPRNVLKTSHALRHFICPDCNMEFRSIVGNIATGHWCPKCKNKTEKQLFIKLQTKFEVQHQFRPKWLKNPQTGRQLSYDFVIHHCKIIIELDGEQHFVQVSNWGTLAYTHYLDMLKMKLANKNGYLIIRLLQHDVFFNTYDWLNTIKDAVSYALQARKNIFLTVKSYYDNWEKELDDFEL